MSDQSERIRSALAELHEQLESADPVDPDLLKLLRTVSDDIRGALEEAGESGEQERSLTDRISDLALHFETSHPLIAATLNRLTHNLSSMGI